jgi:hypothetical protein
MITPDEAKALVSVLSLAENHQMWTNHWGQSVWHKPFLDEQYAAIQTVRAFLKRNGIVTLHAVAERLAEEAQRK